MLNLSTKTAFFLLCSSSLLAAPASKNWGQFRGPGGSGIAPDSMGLPVTFDAATNLSWRTPLAAGHSSPCIWDDRIFLTGYADEKLVTYCMDRSSGEIVWQRTAPTQTIEKVHRVHNPATPTPVADGHHVFIYFGSYGLLCYDFEGNMAWRRALPPPQNTFGTAVSPILAGDFLIFNHDSNGESYLEAIAGETGKTVWRTERPGFKSGWSTPMYWRNNGTDEIVVYGVWWLTAYALSDGRERWSVPGLADEPSITPVTGEGLVFVTSYNMRSSPEAIGIPEFDRLLADYDTDRDGFITRVEALPNQSILSRFDADGEGDHPLRIFYRMLDRNRDDKLSREEWQKIFDWMNNMQHENALLAIRPARDHSLAEIAWKHTRGVPEIPSPLYHDGRVYMVKNGGIFTSLDAKTGTLLYQERIGAGGPYYASPVAGDNKIYMASARGDVTVLAAADELNILATNKLGERILATPAVIGGKVYVRTEKALYAFGGN